MARAALLALLLCAACLAARAAGDNTPFFADLLANARFGTPAKTTDYYGYSETEIACLSQQNFKHCRLTECPSVTCDFLNFFVQTDFTCCPKTQHYGYGQDHQIGTVGFSDKIGTCDWDIRFYRSAADDTLGDISPIPTDDGTALKYATIDGTCYLNANAEHCDSPLCERMAISFQGGLYASDAYSTESTDTPWAETDTDCTAFEPDRRRSTDASKTGARAAGGSLTDKLKELLDEAKNILKPNSGRRAAPAPAAAKPAQAKLADYEAKADPLFEGTAWIVSGTFYETSKHDGSKIEETGLLEWALYFEPDTPQGGGNPVSIGTEPTNPWPVIRSKTAKLRFTKEKEGYYGHDGHERT